MTRLAFITFIAVALVGTLAAGTALAEQVKCEGKIAKIDGDKVTVTDSSSNQDKQITLLPATKVMLNGKPATRNDLKVGQQVSCTSDKQGDKMTCSTIEVKSN
jgi:uncharacterized Zn-binding protein involved in type VI secretion